MKLTFEGRNDLVGRCALLILTALSISANVNVPALGAGDIPPDWEDRIRLGVNAYEKGETRAAFDIFYKMSTDGASRFGASDGRMARIYTNMGEVYSEQQTYNYAEQCLQRGLNLARTGYGPNSLQCVPALIDLAQLYVRQGKFTQAQPLFKQALSIVDKPGDEKLLPYVVVIETDMGAMFFSAGNYALGEPHFKRALSLANTVLGANHKWTTTIGAMYAACLNADGKSQEAKAIEQAAKAKANEAQSPIFVWNKQMGLADDAMAAKKFTEAEAALKLAMQVTQELPSEPMLQVLTLTQYGRLFLLQEKPALTIEKWKVAQSIADATLGADDHDVLSHAKELADLERAQEQYADAEPLYTRLVAQAKKEFGPDSDQYEAALSDLAGVYNSWAQYPKAVTYYSKVLALQEKKFGPDSDKLIPTLVALATVAQNNTKYFSEVNEHAEEYLKRASAIATKHFGKNSKEEASVLDALSRYYHRHFDWDKAGKTCLQVIAIDEKTFGADSSETLKALEHYAVVLRAAGLRNEAEPVEARIAKIKGAKTPADD